MSDATAAVPPATPSPAPQPSHLWKDGKSFGFHDFLDLINPLQHLPIIGSVYRWATGDEPGDVARVAGDTLYGGPIGLALGLLATATEDDKGRDLGERTVAALFGSGGDSDSTPKVAAAPAAAPPPAPVAANAAWLSAFPQVAKNGAAPSPAEVASLYASPPAVPAQKAAGSAPPVLDHPPMPLRHRVGATGAPLSAIPAVLQTAAKQDPAVRAFLTHTAMPQPQTAAGPSNPEARQLNNHPVPLQLSGGLSFSLEQPHALKVAAPAAAPSPVAVTPAQIPQKMMEALDKYRRLQQQLDLQNAAADTVPGGAGLTP